MPDLVSQADDSWRSLRQLTDARIGLGRAGAGIPTGETLRFKLAHAQARDAVHTQLDIPLLQSDLSASSVSPVAKNSLHLQSQARERSEYLRRPDFGRRLSKESHDLLTRLANPPSDLAIVIADGLSALAIQRNVVPFLEAFLPLIGDLAVAPLTLIEQGRVAVGDEIGHLLHARAVVVFIGERPGLSSPDSMGIYLTYDPHPGLTDERRNCISNVRPAGLSYPAAAAKLAWLLRESFRRSLSGVELKDETTTTPKLEVG